MTSAEATTPTNERVFKFVLVKPSDVQNIDMAKRTCQWAVPCNKWEPLSRLFTEANTMVILLFSCYKEPKQLLGASLMMTNIDSNGERTVWADRKQYSPFFRVEWLTVHAWASPNNWLHEYDNAVLKSRPL